MSVENAPDAPKLASFSLAKTEKTPKFDISGLNQEELLELHAKVEANIVGLRLSDVNLEKEAFLAFQRAKLLQERATTTNDVPVNQLAQVQNSLRNTLDGLAKLQTELHSSETIKRWKAALVRVLKKQPKPFQDEFFEAIEHEATVVEQEMSE